MLKNSKKRWQLLINSKKEIAVVDKFKNGRRKAENPLKTPGGPSSVGKICDRRRKAEGANFS